MKALNRDYAWIALAALLPVLPYLAFGYAGHDMELHVTSWMEVADAWRAGMLYPGWSTHANFMLGDAHFSFYPPLSFVLGGALAVLLPMHLVPAAFMWVAAVAAGLAMYGASGSFVDARSRLPAALLYLLSPYFVTTLLVRFAAAELLVQSIVPLVLLACWRGIWLGERRWVAAAGVLLAAAWLTNIPAAIVLFYGLLPAVVFCAFQRRSIMPAIQFALAEVLAVALAAFHLLPVLAEKGWISQGLLVRQDPRVLLMFFDPGAPSIQVMRTYVDGLWLIAIGSACVGAVCLVSRRAADLRTRFLVSLGATALFFQTPLAAPLWQVLPQLGSAAFPYRFLPLLGAPVILLLLNPKTHRRWLGSGVIVLALLTLVPFTEFAIVQSRPQTRMPSFRATLERWNTQGYQGFPEFVPAGTSVTSSDLTQRASGTCVTEASKPLSLKPYVLTASSVGCTVRFATLAYPYWRATLDGATRLPLTRSPDGRIIAQVPAGTHRLELAFVAVSETRSWSLILSLITAFGLLVFFWRTPKAANEKCPVQDAGRGTRFT